MFWKNDERLKKIDERLNYHLDFIKSHDEKIEVCVQIANLVDTLSGKFVEMANEIEFAKKRLDLVENKLKSLEELKKEQ